MSHMRSLGLLVAGCAAVSSLLISSSVAGAHEHRQVGPIAMTVGWADEPSYTGFKNGVQLLLKDAAGKPITDLGDTLKVAVIFGAQKTALQPLELAFDPDTGLGTPGAYTASIIPTRPGTYTFRFVGSIRGRKIDESFTSSEKTFNSVEDSTAAEFPAKDPSAGELATSISRLGPRIDAARAAAQDAGRGVAQSRMLAIAGIILGAVGIVVGLRRRRG